MNGFYSIWSKPYFDSKKTTEYRMHDFELLTLILSLNVWQRENGDALLIADNEALKYLEKLDILRLFNSGYKDLIVDKSINSGIFWAAGKLFSLLNLDDNRAMVDLDLVVWKNIDKEAANSDIYVIHREEITDHVYPNPNRFFMNSDFSFDSDMDLTVEPCNTALLCYKDIDFIHEYANKSIFFMKNCLEKSDNLCPMVFAEQRLISIEAIKAGKTIGSIYPYASDIFVQDTVTHLWGHKNILKFNYSERAKFCSKILVRLEKEFPESYDICLKSNLFNNYLNLSFDL